VVLPLLPPLPRRLRSARCLCPAEAAGSETPTGRVQKPVRLPEALRVALRSMWGFESVPPTRAGADGGTRRWELDRLFQAPVKTSGAEPGSPRAIAGAATGPVRKARRASV